MLQHFPLRQYIGNIYFSSVYAETNVSSATIYSLMVKRKFVFAIPPWGVFSPIGKALNALVDCSLPIVCIATKMSQRNTTSTI